MTRIILAAAVGCLALAACNQASEPAAEPAAPLTLHAVMKEQIDANADALWELTNPALNETASFDPAMMDEAMWTRIIELSGNAERGARTLAALDPIMVALPGVKVSDQDIENGHTAAQVQAFVDADPDTLRNLANTLADHMAAISAAAVARDPVLSAQLIDQLDGVCESCHLEYWYPEQADLVRSIRQTGGDDAAPAAR